jgi:hypothetical protein
LKDLALSQRECAEQLTWGAQADGCVVLAVDDLCQRIVSLINDAQIVELILRDVGYGASTSGN